MLDIHTHILPATDDGSKSAAMTERMLKAAKAANIDRIIATPHITKRNAAPGIYKNFSDTFEAARQVGIRLYAGGELRINVFADAKDEALYVYKLGAEGFFLLEFSTHALPVDWEFIISDFVQHGYHPVIAHPERYEFIQKDIMIAKELINYGCELQLDAGGLIAGMFSREQRVARRMLDQGMISYIASDAHKPEDYEAFDKARKMFSSDWPQDGLLEKILV